MPFEITVGPPVLTIAFTHGVLGANYSIRDHVHGDAPKRVLQVGLVLLWAVLIALGAGIIFLFHGVLS